MRTRQVQRIVGLYSGTSTDGVDAALVAITGSGVEQNVRVLATLMLPFDEETRRRIFALYPPNRVSAEEVSQMNFDLGELYAQAVLQVIEKAGLRPSDVSCVGSRGLTVFHGPPRRPGEERGHRLEIGEAAVLAERTGLTVVSDLGYRDVAACGVGGVLGSYVDYVLFHHPALSRAVQNIGGIANVTFIPRGSGSEEILSFDTGPGNVFLDFAAQMISAGELTYDRDGAIAARGRVSQELLADLLEQPYLRRSPPKTTGRELFSRDMFEQIAGQAEHLRLSGEDLLATLTVFTAESIVLNYRRFLEPIAPIDEVILRGGGAFNKTLVRMLQERLAGTPVRLHEDYGYPTLQREAIDWAVLAGESMRGALNNLPNVTGARRRMTLGKFTPGAFGWQGDTPFPMRSSESGREA